jgi:hypothetical protein
MLHTSPGSAERENRALARAETPAQIEGARARADCDRSDGSSDLYGLAIVGDYAAEARLRRRADHQIAWPKKACVYLIQREISACRGIAR